MSTMSRSTTLLAARIDAYFRPRCICGFVVDRLVRHDLIQDGSEGLDPEEAATADISVPSYVSDPRVTEQGMEIYVDGGGAMDAPMAATLRRVLREELEGVVATARVVAVR